MKKILPFYDFVLGFLYLLFTTLEYIPAFNIEEVFHFGDWCFVTGIIGGVIFIVSGILELRGKGISVYLHFYNTVLLSLIFIGTIAIGLNLGGNLWFLHVFGPLFVLFRFFAFCDCRKIGKASKVWLLGLAPVVYIVLTFIILLVSGKCPFPARMLFQFNNYFITAGGTAALILVICGYGFCLYYLNVVINRKFRK